MTIKIRSYQESPTIYCIELETGDIKLATLNIMRGTSVYNERLIEVGGKEYRFWDPYRSKLAASILKGIPKMPISTGCGVLYLGAASGTTVSHVSDIVGTTGRVYAVEFSPRPLRELINKLSARINVFPIFADARFPLHYKLLIENVDVVYCDIAQPEQAKVLVDNSELLLRGGGYVLIAIKARSIDSTREPEEVFKEQIDLLKHRGLNILAVVSLEPYDRDHLMVLAKG